MSSEDTLKQRMREFTEGKVDSVNVSSADLGGSGGEGTDSGYSPTKGTVKAKVPKEADDAFSEAKATGEIHKSMSPSFIGDEIDISDADRSAFLSAIVSGGRYERSFSLFGGRLTGTFRCRSILESDGIIAWLSHCVSAKKLDARIEYLSTMRNALLAAQVKSLRGLINEDFPEFQAPYAPTRSNDGAEVVEPGWVKLCDHWSSMPEAVVSAIHSELQLFERRYWTMVSSASDENFWHPAASI